MASHRNLARTTSTTDAPEKAPRTNPRWAWRSTLAFIVAAGLATLWPSGRLAAQGEAGIVASPYAPSPQDRSSADRAQLVDLIARMNHAIDAGNYAAYAGFYADGGAIDSGFGPPVTGRPAIVASLEKSAPFISNKRHVASNIVIDVSGDSATAVYYLIVFERASGLTLAGTALITDTFRRRDGRWEVTTHTTRMDPATLEAMSAAMARGGG